MVPGIILLLQRVPGMPGAQVRAIASKHVYNQALKKCCREIVKIIVVNK
jgi:hypothetical protein